MTIPKIEIAWQTVAILVATLIAFVVTFAVASPEQRDVILAGIGSVGGVLLALSRAMLSRASAVPLALALAASASACGASASPTFREVSGAACGAARLTCAAVEATCSVVTAGGDAAR